MLITFELGGEATLVKIQGHSVLFSNAMLDYTQWVTIDAIKLNKQGIIKEFPDLVNKEEGEIISTARQRFKEKIKSMNNEEEIKEYIIQELKGLGYTPRIVQRDGWRAKKI